MDGERDPRNLVLCFQCLQYMTKYLDIGNRTLCDHSMLNLRSVEPYKEELFEVVACYFPMEYKPVSNAGNHPPEGKVRLYFDDGLVMLDGEGERRVDVMVCIDSKVTSIICLWR